MPPPSPPLLVLVIPTIAFFLWLIANPSFLFTHRVRPSSSIHKSWDSLNIFLVLFAILCGVFARKNDDDSSDNNTNASTSNSSSEVSQKEGEDEKRSVSNPSSWFDQFSNDRPAGRLKRSSSSYPDLRPESWENENRRFRFFDDFELTNRLYTSSPSSQYIHRRTTPTPSLSEPKEIQVDTFVLRAPPSPSPPPPPPPPPPPRQTVYKTIPRKEKFKPPAEKTPPPPPPPPPPRPPPSPLVERKYVKNGKKKSNATKEIKIILASLYNQRKRKKKQRNMKNHTNTYDSISSQPTSYFRPPPSPPPPPPPPPSKFYNLFHKRNHKTKKIHSFSSPPPPPPPPCKLHRPPPTPPRIISPATGKPPLPTRNYSYYEENVNSGNQSPLIPPPPPPPPFKVQGFRFVVSGDYVRIRSASSSRCGSPSREEIVEVTAARDINGGGAWGSCPSPDVNVKADSFIARLRDEWRLEKVNSHKGKNLSPSPS